MAKLRCVFLMLVCVEGSDYYLNYLCDVKTPLLITLTDGKKLFAF